MQKGGQNDMGLTISAIVFAVGAVILWATSLSGIGVVLVVLGALGAISAVAFRHELTSFNMHRTISGNGRY
jgi:hypothetical protein